jgi:hypothetical protein
MAVPLPPSTADLWNMFRFFLYVSIAVAAQLLGL